jgi:hypothetical protein
MSRILVNCLWLSFIIGILIFVIGMFLLQYTGDISEDSDEMRVAIRFIMTDAVLLGVPVVVLIYRIMTRSITSATARPATSAAKPVVAAAKGDTTQQSLQIPAADFASCAAKGPAWSRLSISRIPQVITELNAEMKRLNITSDAFYDLYNNSLLGVCPKCNEYCAGKAFLRMPLFAAVGDRLSFIGHSGGFERMLEGTCLNYSCASREFDLFWCPDLDIRMLQNLRGRGINIDPTMQRLRDHVWKPQ